MSTRLPNSDWKWRTMMSQPERAVGGRQEESASRW